MRLAFFQAAMLTVAVQANESSTQDEAERTSYFPDLLVQTASIVDFFYPFTHDAAEEKSVETALAQAQRTDSEPKPSLHGQVGSISELDLDNDLEADAEAEADAELQAENELDADADAELSAIIDAELDSEANGTVFLDADALNTIETECDGDADCIKEAIKGLTRINH